MCVPGIVGTPLIEHLPRLLSTEGTCPPPGSGGEKGAKNGGKLALSFSVRGPLGIQQLDGCAEREERTHCTGKKRPRSSQQDSGSQTPATFPKESRSLSRLLSLSKVRAQALYALYSTLKPFLEKFLG